MSRLHEDFQSNKWRLKPVAQAEGFFSLCRPLHHFRCFKISARLQWRDSITAHRVGLQSWAL